MTVWMISANRNTYDHEGAFNKWGFIDWRQHVNYEIGDIVYIYSSNPYSAISYKTEVIKADMRMVDKVDDTEFWVGDNPQNETKRYTRLKLLKRINRSDLSFHSLKEHGLNNAPQKALRVKGELLSYIESRVNDDNDIDWMTLDKSVISAIRFIRETSSNPVGLLNLHDESTILRDEIYKYNCFDKGHAALDSDSWDINSYGRGIITSNVIAAMAYTENLVNRQFAVPEFVNKLKGANPTEIKKYDSCFYDVYCGDDEETAFRNVADCFGSKYSLIAFLFFIKDCERYLPTSPERFDEIFKSVGLTFRMSKRCSWDNYYDFLSIIKHVQKFVSEMNICSHEVTLLDAHSLIWIMNYEEYKKWVSNQKETESSNGAEEQDMANKNEISKNTILYGPPGTGKTYNTVIYAVSVIEDKTVENIEEEAKADYSSVKSRYDKYVAEGRISFTTFHQSYGYEEFIEGIKPIMADGEEDIGYRIESGVFKAFCERASIPSAKTSTDYGINKDPSVWKVSLKGTHDNPVRTECLENGHIRIGWDSYGPDISDSLDELPNGKVVLNAFFNVMKAGDIVLSCYTSTEIDAIGVVTGDYEWDDSYDEYKRVRKVKWLVKNIRENIVELNNGNVMTLSTVYRMSVSVREVLNIVEKYSPRIDKRNVVNEDKYVFIIDEINRGNISKIFGELITLIEETKRIGAPEAMTVELPYSHSSFGVPDNVYILGTMNTADRSIAIMDTALRRRFAFEEMLPDTDILRVMGADEIYDDGITVSVADMLDVINERITFLYDREHTIGHAFFTPLQDDPSIETLAKIFETSIIPLLQEYFYEDYNKIQLVLGDDGKTGDNKQYQFISDEEMNPNSLFETVQEMEPDKKYKINYPAFKKIESYKLISKNL